MPKISNKEKGKPLLYPPPREAIKEQIEKAREDIDTGDHVFHTLSREKWVVAIVRDDEVWYCGWPCGWGMKEHCYLIKKASPARKEEVFQDLLKLKHDERGALARHQHALEDSDSVLHY